MHGVLSNEFIKNQVLTISEVTETQHVNDLTSKILTGSTALFVDGLQHVLILGTTKGKSRSIEEPSSEPLVRGPRVGFTESLRDNTALYDSMVTTTTYPSLSFK